VCQFSTESTADVYYWSEPPYLLSQCLCIFLQFPPMAGVNKWCESTADVYYWSEPPPLLSQCLFIFLQFPPMAGVNKWCESTAVFTIGQNHLLSSYNAFAWSGVANWQSLLEPWQSLLEPAVSTWTWQSPLEPGSLYLIPLTPKNLGFLHNLGIFKGWTLIFW
jgi:hypothetical protein